MSVMVQECEPEFLWRDDTVHNISQVAWRVMWPTDGGDDLHNTSIRLEGMIPRLFNEDHIVMNWLFSYICAPVSDIQINKFYGQLMRW